jgi:hypothetical protein
VIVQGYRVNIRQGVALRYPSHATGSTGSKGMPVELLGERLTPSAKFELSLDAVAWSTAQPATNSRVVRTDRGAIQVLRRHCPEPARRFEATE